MIHYEYKLKLTEIVSNTCRVLRVCIILLMHIRGVKRAFSCEFHVINDALHRLLIHYGCHQNESFAYLKEDNLRLQPYVAAGAM